MMKRLPKEHKRYVRLAQEQGWRVEPAADGVKLYSPTGARPVTLHGSPKKNGTSRGNTEMILRQAGMEIPH